MNGIGLFKVILNKVIKSHSGLSDTLALVGLFYIGKLSVKCISNSFCGFKTYILPRLISNDKWLKSLGNWAIVTGCTHGIGLAYAKELAKRGINLILISRNERLLQKISKLLEVNYKIKTIIVITDVNDNESFKKIEKIILAKDIGILVNNFNADSRPSQFHLNTEDSLEEIINIDIKYFTFLTRMVLPDMVKKNKGAIINISSIISTLPANLFCVHASSKAYMDKLTETLQYEYRKTKIVFQCLSPGVVKNQPPVGIFPINAKIFQLNPLKYLKSALCTLGYSRHTCGHWVHSIQFLITKFLPKRVINLMVFRNAERVISKLREKHYYFDEPVDDDIDLILNED